MIKPNRRRHPRFAATAFLNTPVVLSPLPPFFGDIRKGKLIDLSAGGMAILIKEVIPQGTKLFMTVRFPDLSVMGCTIQIRHVLPRDNRYLHGFEFLDLPVDWQDLISKMSVDYINCESRIQSHKDDICQTTCAFYSMCTKSHKKIPTPNSKVSLELMFEHLNKVAI